MDSFPVIAILRGLLPQEARAIGEVLISHGISILEVPLNSPRPLESIQILAEAFGEDAVIGAGTVLSPEDVENVYQAGGRLVVSPDTHAPVIQATLQRQMLSVPGVLTPTEAFAAIRAGAHALKWFPAGGTQPSMLTAMKAVLPADMPICAVGGVDEHTLATYWEAGANGFGVGGALFRPGDSPATVAQKAQCLKAAWEAIGHDTSTS